jgi:hypothetical protein
MLVEKPGPVGALFARKLATVDIGPTTHHLIIDVLPREPL